MEVDLLQASAGTAVGTADDHEAVGALAVVEALEAAAGVAALVVLLTAAGLDLTDLPWLAMKFGKFSGLYILCTLLW